MSNYIKNYWEKLEKERPPRNVKLVKTIEFKKLLKILKNRNEEKQKLKNLINRLYEGEALIVKNAIGKKQIEKIKKKLVSISNNTKSSFFKMDKKCPNFWRRQDESIAKKYSVSAVRDSYYFFRWNENNKEIWKTFDMVWANIKVLGGLQKDSYINNMPTDGVIDRIQIVRYPEKTGYIEPHFHDPKNQRLIISVYMSKRGVDYLGGGTCFYQGNKKVDVEHKIEVGDVGIFYATLKHAVYPVKKTNKKTDPNFRGRWWCGLYSPESDLVKDRHTSSPSK